MPAGSGLVSICKALQEVEGGHTCIATSIKYGVANYTIFEEVEENHIAKKETYESNYMLGTRQRYIQMVKK